MAAAVISVLRRKVQSPEPARPAPPSEPPPQPKPVRSLDGEMIDGLEADVSRAIRQVTEAIRAASHEVNATRDDLSEIHGSMVDLVAAGRRAASQALGLAASTEELAAASGEITGAMNLADARIAEAVRVAEVVRRGLHAHGCPIGTHGGNLRSPGPAGPEPAERPTPAPARLGGGRKAARATA